MYLKKSENAVLLERGMVEFLHVIFSEFHTTCAEHLMLLCDCYGRNTNGFMIPMENRLSEILYCKFLE